MVLQAIAVQLSIDQKIPLAPGATTLHITGEPFKNLSRCIAAYISVHRRGSAGAYQRWADIVDDQSFSFPNLLPFFQKSPHLTPPNYAKRGADSEVTFDQSAFRSSGGPLQVSYSNFYQPFSPFIKRAFEVLGLKTINGLSSGVLEGFSEFTVTVDPRAATRSSSETSFLQQALSRTNLQVYQRTLAKKINIENKTATSVTVKTAGKSYCLSATKEVILSAGAVCQHRLQLRERHIDLVAVPLTSDAHGVRHWPQKYIRAARYTDASRRARRWSRHVGASSFASFSHRTITHPSRTSPSSPRVTR